MIIRKAEAGDARSVARILAAAMADDPIVTWTLRGRARREQRLQIMFGAIVQRALAKADHEVHICDDGSGAALWYGVNRWSMPAKDMLLVIPAMLRSGFSGRRALQLNAVMQKSHPTDEHFYLEVLGALPQHQGRGIGSALLASVLDRCDADGVAAYLENSNPRNEPLYARHGFEPMAPLPLPRGCPPLVPMWRKPR